MFQVLRQQFIGAWNYESQAQQLVVWPRTVAHSPVSDWAIMGEWPVLHQDNFENVKYFQCNKHRPNKNRIGWIYHKSNKRIDPNKTV